MLTALCCESSIYEQKGRFVATCVKAVFSFYTHDGILEVILEVMQDGLPLAGSTRDPHR